AFEAARAGALVIDRGAGFLRQARVAVGDVVAAAHRRVEVRAEQVDAARLAGALRAALAGRRRAVLEVRAGARGGPARRAGAVVRHRRAGLVRRAAGGVGGAVGAG